MFKNPRSWWRKSKKTEDYFRGFVDPAYADIKRHQLKFDWHADRGLPDFNPLYKTGKT